MKTVLKGIPSLYLGNEVFVVDKFSGFDKVNFKIEYYKKCIKINYFIHIYFSGKNLCLKKSHYVDKYKKYSLFFKEATDEYKFILSIDEYKFISYNDNNWLKSAFEKSKYKIEEHSDIIPDEIKWLAKNTNTEKTLEELKKQIEYCFSYIDETYPVKKKKQLTETKTFKYNCTEKFSDTEASIEVRLKDNELKYYLILDDDEIQLLFDEFKNEYPNIFNKFKNDYFNYKN